MQKENLVNRIREALADIPKVEEKRMFRGITFLVDDKMCICVADNEILCRFDPDLHDEVTAKNGSRIMEMKGREYKGFVFVNEAVLNTEKQLSFWVNLSLGFNKRAKSSKKKSKI